MSIEKNIMSSLLVSQLKANYLFFSRLPDEWEKKLQMCESRA